MMSWYNQDNPEEEIIDRPYVSCDEDYELGYIIDRLVKKWGVDRYLAKKAVENCCNKVPPPHPRDEFLECLKDELGL
jgi:hypothetical protein